MNIPERPQSVKTICVHRRSQHWALHDTLHCGRGAKSYSVARWCWQADYTKRCWLSWSRACTQGNAWLEYEYAFGFSAYTDWHHHLWSTECLSLHHTILLLTKWHILYEGNTSMSWYAKCSTVLPSALYFKAYSLIE